MQLPTPEITIQTLIHLWLTVTLLTIFTHNRGQLVQQYPIFPLDLGESSLLQHFPFAIIDVHLAGWLQGTSPRPDMGQVVQVELPGSLLFSFFYVAVQVWSAPVHFV